MPKVIPSILTSTNKLVYFYWLSRRLTIDKYVKTQAGENIKHNIKLQHFKQGEICSSVCFNTMKEHFVAAEIKEQLYKKIWSLLSACKDSVLNGYYFPFVLEKHNTTVYCQLNSEMKWGWSLWNYKLISIKWKDCLSSRNTNFSIKYFEKKANY